MFLGLYTVASVSLEVIVIVIKDVLLHLNMKIYNSSQQGW